MANSHSSFDEKGIEEAYALLFEICTFLDSYKITYHLEGGTLLGFIRDNSLIPWDHDLDISIPESELSKLLSSLKFLSKKWRISKRYFSISKDYINSNNIRLIKIKNRKFHFFPGDLCLDIFVKYENNKNVYWQAGDFLMLAQSKYYDGFDEYTYKDFKFKIPKHSDDYLTQKYGDWHIVDKEWKLAKEKTISSK